MTLKAFGERHRSDGLLTGYRHAFASTPSKVCFIEASRHDIVIAQQNEAREYVRAHGQEKSHLKLAALEEQYRAAGYEQRVKIKEDFLYLLAAVNDFDVVGVDVDIDKTIRYQSWQVAKAVAKERNGDSPSDRDIKLAVLAVCISQGDTTAASGIMAEVDNGTFSKGMKEEIDSRISPESEARRAQNITEQLKARGIKDAILLFGRDHLDEDRPASIPNQLRRLGVDIETHDINDDTGAISRAPLAMPRKALPLKSLVARIMAEP